MSFRRMLPFILINILVSAAVVLAILYWWDGRESEQAAPSTVTAVAAGAPTAVTAPAISPQATETPESEGDEPTVHVVTAGETLGSLSQFYDVPLDDIMTANGLTDPNIIAVGQQLIIPVGGLPEPTPEPTNPPAPTSAEPPTPIPTEASAMAGEPDVQITAAVGVDDLAEEAIQLTNFGTSQVALMGWRLVDSEGNIYTFGQVTLFGDGAAIQVHTEKGQDGPADLYWGLESPIWESGERVTLLDGEGVIQTTFDIP